VLPPEIPNEKEIDVLIVCEGMVIDVTLPAVVLGEAG